MRKPNILIFLLSILTAVVVALPVLRSGQLSTFYSTDPDVHYLSNALTYIQFGKITYNSHPGTPAIVLIANLLLPLRVYSRIALHTPFVDWSFSNINLIYHYVRLSSSVLLGFSMCIFLAAVYKMTRSLIAACISVIALFTYTAFPYIGSTISAENTLFFLTSAWLWIFVHYLKLHSKFALILLIIIAAIAMATKFTSIPLAIASFLIFAGSFNSYKKKTAVNLLRIGLLFILVFVISTWPIRSTYPQMILWFSSLATTSETHGGGTKAIFNLASYISSVSGLRIKEIWAASISLTAVVGFTMLLVRRRYEQSRSLVILVVSTIFSILVIAKYPLSHYQIVTFALVVFIASLSISLLPKFVQAALIIIFIFPAISNIQNSYITIAQASAKTKVLEKYIQNHPPLKATVWVWGRSKDYALLWSRDWGNGLYSKQLIKYRPNLLELESNLDYVNIDGHTREQLFKVCWDQLYLPETVVPVFLSKYPQHSVKHLLLANTDDMAIIESDHCLTKP